jgi:hypothetical protein
LGNKVDKENERRIQKQKAQQWCQSKNVQQPIQHFETSAKEATSVEEAFQTIAKTALSKGQEDDMYVFFFLCIPIQYSLSTSIDIHSYVPETIDLSGAAGKTESRSCC